ncbi:3-isopropylmalate dehydratase small subunit [Pseudomonas putida]|uniref:3-isopropylmalate dehydratase small subunit n=1 Tax=Pseudomonas putida (strain ATCC 700007 / DSM 6899 / JCM 31910 / BCRC 17059 / LMG 24140 / F1) TaxID=351746 RepID=A5WAI1_PSEP1|nr:3-isopropylmalate dehydratase small subunit [Pseudomonas putida]MDD1996466.1 3-isopropylmalate dehydratase small subunit [Pseudomonas putida]HDS1787624.1 3-isopropylmalate dehydratase small subunit [Pseudomonas putida]
MQPFTFIKSKVVPLDRANVDTDAILPKQFLMIIERSGFGQHLFDEWRYLDHGVPYQDCSNRPLNLSFPLNQPRFEGAGVLLTRGNFGCGSSREHAPWALHDWGIRAIIAPSFAEIFYGNCFKNGILPIILDEATVEKLFLAVEHLPGYQLSIDLKKQEIVDEQGNLLSFDIDPFRKHCLLNGLDEVGMTLLKAGAIQQFEKARIDLEPWLYQRF